MFPHNGLAIGEEGRAVDVSGRRRAGENLANERVQSRTPANSAFVGFQHVPDQWAFEYRVGRMERRRGVGVLALQGLVPAIVNVFDAAQVLRRYVRGRAPLPRSWLSCSLRYWRPGW